MIERHTVGMYAQSRSIQRGSQRTRVVLLAGAFAIIGWIWLICISGYFDIGEVVIENNQAISAGEIINEIHTALHQTSWRPWRSTNLFFLNTEQLTNELSRRLFVERIEIEKRYPNIVRLKIFERQRKIILVSQERYVYVDAAGLVTEEVSDEALRIAQEQIAAKRFSEDANPPVIVMSTDDPLVTGFQVASVENVKKWLETFRTLIARGVKMRFMKIEAPDAHLGRFVSQKGYDIYFDLHQPLEPQITTYLAYINTKPKEDAIHEYLDPRIPGKIFVK